MTMYTMTKSGVLKKGGQVIPLDDGTPEYQAYVAWLAQGNGPELVEDSEPAYPRIQVTAWQLIQALGRQGLYSVVEQAVQQADDLTRAGWNRAPFFFSDQALVIALAASIGISRAELQSTFELAAGL